MITIMNKEISKFLKEYANKHQKLVLPTRKKLQKFKRKIRYIKKQDTINQLKLIDEIMNNINTPSRLIAFCHFISNDIKSEILGTETSESLVKKVSTNLKIHYNDVMKMYQQDIFYAGLYEDMLCFHTKSMFDQIDKLANVKTKLSIYKRVFNIPNFVARNPILSPYPIYKNVTDLIENENDIKLCKIFINNYGSSNASSLSPSDAFPELIIMLINNSQYTFILKMIDENLFRDIYKFGKLLFDKIKKIDIHINMYEYELKFEIVYRLAKKVRKLRNNENKLRLLRLLYNDLVVYYNLRCQSLIGLCINSIKYNKKDISQLSKDIKIMVNNLNCSRLTKRFLSLSCYNKYRYGRRRK